MSRERGVFVVFADVADGEREEAFDRWYDEEHLGEVLGVPGIVAATRYRRLEPVEASSPIGHRHLCIYEIESDDLPAVQRALADAAPAMRIGTAMSRDPRPVTMWLREVADRRTS